MDTTRVTTNARDARRFPSALAVSSSNNAQLNISHFQNVSIVTAPGVVNAAYLASTSLNKLSFTFDQDVLSLHPENLKVSPGGIIASSVDWDAGTKTATFTLPLPLANGDYTATLNATATQNLAGDAMSADYTLPLFVLVGDADRDRAVNALDFNVLATHYGASGATMLNDGDFNFDGHVDSLDFNLLANGFGTQIAVTGAGERRKLRQTRPILPRIR